MGIEQDIKQSKFKSAKHKALVNVLYTAAWLQYRQGKVFRKYGLTAPQFNILRILRGQHPNPASVNLLIDRMIDKSSNASRIVEKLRSKGLVVRVECPNDRRQVEITITDQGLNLLQLMDKQEQAALSEPFGLTDDEAETLNHLLDRIRS
jgi:DNA-binding MarR family transcriptional regulator